MQAGVNVGGQPEFRLHVSADWPVHGTNEPHGGGVPVGAGVGTLPPTVVGAVVATPVSH